MNENTLFKVLQQRDEGYCLGWTSPFSKDFRKSYLQFGILAPKSHVIGSVLESRYEAGTQSSLMVIARGRGTS